MDGRRIKERHVHIALPDQQRYLRTPQYHALHALQPQFFDDAEEDLPARLRQDILHQFRVDDVVEDGRALRLCPQAGDIGGCILERPLEIGHVRRRLAIAAQHEQPDLPARNWSAGRWPAARLPGRRLPRPGAGIPRPSPRSARHDQSPGAAGIRRCQVPSVVPCLPSCGVERPCRPRPCFSSRSVPMVAPAARLLSAPGMARPARRAPPWQTWTGEIARSRPITGSG